MKVLTALFCVHLVAIGVVCAGDATTILTFDELSPGPDHAIIQNGYGGLNWNNFSVINGSLRPPTEGYHTGIVSPSNLAFNTSGDPASIGSSTPFDLKSAYLSAALNLESEMQVEVQGFLGTTLIYDTTHAVNGAAPTLIDFNYVGVDQVKFISSPPVQFAMDNLTVVLGRGEPLPEVWIAATVPETLEPSPTTRMRPGEFTITRVGDTNNPLLLFLEFSGTATFGQDYEEVSQHLVMPAGERKLTVLVASREDSAVEGDETVIATLSTNPPINSLPNYRVDPLRNRAAVVIHDNNPPESPVLSLELVDPDAMETLITQNNIDWAEFRVLRTGPAAQELVVFLDLGQGSARLGEDYSLEGVTEGSNVRFPAGIRSVNVRLYPIDDDSYEGDETVFLHLIAPPDGTPVPDRYAIDLAHSSVGMVIHDNDPITTLLKITSPHDGQQFQPGDIIELRAEIIGPGGSRSWSIEFFDGDHRIGTTQPDGVIWWGDASGGQHVISARATDSQGAELTSTSLTIQVGPGATLPVVKISAISWKTGEPCPTCFVAPGVLTIERTLPTNTTLTVFLAMDGTATAGDDYQALPASVDIPAGQRSAQLTLLPLDDQLVEGPEVVRVRVLSQPPPLLPPTYFVNGNSNEALVVIHDDEPKSPEARLDILAPTNGSRFPFPSTLQLSALAVYTQNEVYGPVEFYAGDQLVATSPGTATTRPAIPGLPSVHTAYWVNPPVGQHVLSARTRISLNQSITSPPVNVTVDSPMFPVVSLETFPPQNPQAREFCPPNLECAYPSFVVRRSGPTNADLRVYLSYSGTAAAGIDYPSLPESLVIPAGHDSAFLMLVPIDDTLVEGPETVIARFTPVPGPGYMQDPDHASAAITIIDNEPSLDTVVSIRTEDEVASEVSLLAVIDPARFRISRTGDLSRELLVFYSVHGSATPGVDYKELSNPIRIPAGESSVTFDITPKFDQLTEGMETVYIRLEPSPLMGPAPTYDIAPAVRDAVAIILDNGSEPSPGLEMVRPEADTRFTAPASIEIVVAAYHPTRDISRVDFYADEVKIGESIVVFDRQVSGGLIVHRFTWNNPPDGVHLLTARGFDEPDHPLLDSKPVRITVGQEPPPPVVSIEATQPVAEESAEPLRRMNLIGEFTISRTGPTDQPQRLFVHYSGMATPVVDYPDLPWMVTIPAGAVSTTIQVVPINDGMPEGIETLVATLSDCPPATDPPLGVPCVAVNIDPARRSAVVFIRDDGITGASLVITEPKSGANFLAGETILIEATAIDLEGYISRVEFWDGEQKIGVSEIVFIRAPDPGSPIYHSFEWQGAAPGPHVLTVRAPVGNGTALKSLPVSITVGPIVNQPPRIAITRPASGTQFPPGIPIEIVAETRDPDGYVPKVEFYADGRKIGERNVVFIRPPEPGQSQTFTFVWQHPTPEPHMLTARATDDDNATATSAPVGINVVIPDILPIVSVVARDAFAVEPSSNTDLNTAAFRIRRFGSTSGELLVKYSLRGTAQNGADYETLSGLAIIAAGQQSTTVTVRPLTDNLAERIETVILRLEEPSAEQPPTYRVGFRRNAVALISDNLQWRSSASARCASLQDGFVYLCFPGQTGQNFRLEASSNLRDWETLFDSPAIDGALDFVEDDTATIPNRFYRLVPEPVFLIDE
jgi:hypothetical protein